MHQLFELFKNLNQQDNQIINIKNSTDEIENKKQQKS